MKISVNPRLSEILKERAMTQMTLSALSGVPQGSISRFDSNSRHEAAHMFAIARALGINVEELFTVSVDKT
ncbi:hypothetical protein PAECIP111893_03197 [Paenibacillus plantiphilus]|uniref:HTH cro/C1-type domain-containing protein n=1 Tax=Paenibacillus plantiphilus TaxID=2905650 RepID=A0ABN8GJD4_9BACL|nr:helix-turn-helix transcriptional regulator [Paenibacillus plantiphilus]CAH1210316.1 hypothetical protein PAECIP111893_03197 [Paenibacillus plantiphilus]